MSGDQPRPLPPGALDMMRDLALACLAAGHTEESATTLWRAQVASVQDGWGGEVFREYVRAAFALAMTRARVWPGLDVKSVSPSQVQKALRFNGGDGLDYRGMPPSVRFAVVRNALGALAAKGEIRAVETPNAGFRFAVVPDPPEPTPHTPDEDAP